MINLKIHRTSKKPLQLKRVLNKDFFGNEYHLDIEKKILYVKFFTYNAWLTISSIPFSEKSIEDIRLDIMREIKIQFGFISDVEQIFKLEGLL
jgi:hypothetical protein